MKEINEIINKITEAIDNNKLSYDDFRLLLQMSGISEDDVNDFFIYTEDGLNGLIVGISKSKLKKQLTFDNVFLDKISENTSKILNIQKKDKIIANSKEVRSVLLVTKNPGATNDILWIVFNGDFKNKAQFSLKGKISSNSYIKTFFDIVYKGDRQVDFNKDIASSINSKIFEKTSIKGNFKQTTLVHKFGEKFRKNNEIEIKHITISLLDKESQEFFPK